jgi:hypothetical protein
LLIARSATATVICALTIRLEDRSGHGMRKKKEGRSRERGGPKSREETPKEGYDAEASRILT